MEIIEDSKGVVGILYIGPKIAHKGADNLIQGGSYIFGGTTTRGNNWSARVACFVDLRKQVEP